MSDPHARILIVEDEADIRRFVRLALASAGYEVHEADGVQRGLIEAGTRRPDLVVLDIKLANVSGLDLLQTIRAETTTLPVVLSTAYDSFQYDLKSIAADAYCVKSVDLGVLKETIEAVLQKKK